MSLLGAWAANPALNFAHLAPFKDCGLPSGFGNFTGPLCNVINTFAGRKPISA
jgi:hypothetical protein